MTADYLLSGHLGLLHASDCTSIQGIANAPAGSGLGVVKFAALEAAAITNALALCNGNRTHAAKQLGISVRTLQRKLKSRPIAIPADETG